MKPDRMLTVLAALFAVSAASAAMAAEGPGIQAAADSREAQVLQSECTAIKPPAPPNFAARARRGARPGANAQGPSGKYHVTAIPGIIKAGARWKTLWSVPGDDADGIIATPDGGILIARNNDSDVVKLMPNGKHSVVYQDTDTGGALSQNKMGQLFVDERGLRASIWELSPEHKVLANRYMGGPLDCIGGVLNDLVAPAFGGAYFTMGAAPNGGLFYAAPDGTVTQYGKDLRTNGIALSPDEKTLYVTNTAPPDKPPEGSIVAFDVQPNGALTNQRTLAVVPGGGGDGMTVDSNGNIYDTGYAGVRVVSAEGQVLGTIPAPLNLISVVFSGKDKKTLFAVGEVRTNHPNFSIGIAGFFAKMVIMSIPMQAQGYADRAK
ncbi:MAG TPA: SMP-30/gluconolactonase/LRE family protein [Steroidobacteraceae bacterium]|nr:SMP-30/gluconolactonase/LRE family protein [Steroidobacteraceae bacterium]